MFTVFGIAYSFGAFFAPMSREFGAGRAAVSLVFSITAFLWFTLGAISGPLADRFGPRRVVLAGGAALGGGLLLTSLVNQLWAGYITYGLGVGIGVACGYVPMVAAVGGWFERRRALAVGIAVTGIGVGTLAVPPLSALLIDRFGWRTAYVVLGVASLALIGLAALAASPPPAAMEADRRPLGGVVRSRAFWLMYLSAIPLSFALFFFFVHLVPFAQSRGAAPVAAAGLLSVVGGGSILGRLGMGVVAERLGSLATFKAAVAAMAFSTVVWLLFPQYGGLVAVALIMGTAYGGWVALSPSVAAELFGTAGLGGTVGILYTSAGIGALLGPPLSGVLIDVTGTYTWAIVAALVFEIVSLGILLPVSRTWADRARAAPGS
jgi:MFS family permease